MPKQQLTLFVVTSILPETEEFRIRMNISGSSPGLMTWSFHQDTELLRGTSSSLVQPPRGWRCRTGFLNPLSTICLLQLFINKACPLCTGFLSWNANTASALNSRNLALSWPGHLYIPSNQPVTAVIDHPDVRMTIIEHSKLPGTSFLLLVFIELWVSYDGFWSPIVA